MRLGSSAAAEQSHQLHGHSFEENRRRHSTQRTRLLINGIKHSGFGSCYSWLSVPFIGAGRSEEQPGLQVARPTSNLLCGVRGRRPREERGEGEDLDRNVFNVDDNFRRTCDGRCF